MRSYAAEVFDCEPPQQPAAGTGHLIVQFPQGGLEHPVSRALREERADPHEILEILGLAEEVLIVVWCPYSCDSETRQLWQARSRIRLARLPLSPKSVPDIARLNPGSGHPWCSLLLDELEAK